MAEHTIETRILLRYDTLDHWLNSTVILKPGEAAIAASTFDYTIEGTNDRPEHTPPAIGIKVGDGYHYFSELPWVQAVAGDVYSWAKQQTKPQYNANESSGLTALIQQCIQEAGGGSGGGGTGPVTVEARAYRLIQGTGNDAHKYYLQSKGANDNDWVTDELHYIDLGQLASVLEWLAPGIEDYWDITGFTVEKVNARLQQLNYTDVATPGTVVTAVNQNNGRISVVHGSVDASSISGVLDVEHGGTGRTNLDTESVLVGNGIGAILTRPIETTLTNDNHLATNRAIKAYVDNATAGITGAMHFIGEATVEISNNSSVNPRIDGYNFMRAAAGDVILFNAAEYVWTGSVWRLLGEEGSYAIKGSITNADIAEDANIAQSKIADLVSDLDSKVDKEDGKGLSTNDFTNEYKNKLDDIEDNAQRNVIEHVYVNGTEVSPSTVEGNPNSVALRVSALTPEEEEKIANIEAGAQVNRIEHIFLNENELNITTVKNLSKSVNISINEYTTGEKEKLAGIENGAEVNTIEKIFFNENEFQPNEDKEVHVTLDAAALNLNVLEGAQVPYNNTVEDVTVVNKKLQLARIAVTSDVSDLKQMADTYIILDCGSSTDVI